VRTNAKVLLKMKLIAALFTLCLISVALPKAEAQNCDICEYVGKIL
jgi:hypothetical protein